MHIWPMSTTETAFTAHLVIPAGHPGDAFQQLIARELEQRFGIHHPTIQIEQVSEECRLGAHGGLADEVSHDHPHDA
jgi:cobalt-zinc-cadmium efflux system protein